MFFYVKNKTKDLLYFKYIFRYICIIDILHVNGSIIKLTNSNLYRNLNTLLKGQMNEI